MANGDHMKVSLNVSRDELQRAVEAALEAHGIDLSKRLERTSAEKEDAYRKAINDLLQRVDGLSDRVDNRSALIDSDLEKLQTRVNTRVNTYVIPAVVFTFIALVLAIFTALGGFGVITNVQKLKEDVDTAQTQYKTTSATLALLTTNVNAAKATADADQMIKLSGQLLEVTNKLNAVNVKLADVTAELDKLKHPQAIPKSSQITPGTPPQKNP